MVTHNTLSNTPEENNRSKFLTFLIIISFISPFFFSGIFMVVIWLLAQNLEKRTKGLLLIFAAFLGILTSIGFIFALQRLINNKLSRRTTQNSD